MFAGGHGTQEAAGSAATATLAYKGQTEQGASSSPYTFAACDIGSADATRVVIVAVYYWAGGSINITGVTVGGISATLRQAGGANFTCALYSAAVPTGATASVVVTTNVSAAGIGIGWWTSVNQSDAAPTDVQVVDDTTNDNPLTLSINVPANGFVVAASTFERLGGGVTVTWGGTGITERFDVNSGGSALVQDGGADNPSPVANAAYSITALPSITGGMSGARIAALSWK